MSTRRITSLLAAALLSGVVPWRTRRCQRVRACLAERDPFTACPR